MIGRSDTERSSSKTQSQPLKEPLLDDESKWAESSSHKNTKKELESYLKSVKYNFEKETLPKSLSLDFNSHFLLISSKNHTLLMFENSKNAVAFYANETLSPSKHYEIDEAVFAVSDIIIDKQEKSVFIATEKGMIYNYRIDYDTQDLIKVHTYSIFADSKVYIACCKDFLYAASYKKADVTRIRLFSENSGKEEAFSDINIIDRFKNIRSIKINFSGTKIAYSAHVDNKQSYENKIRVFRNEEGFY